MSDIPQVAAPPMRRAQTVCLLAAGIGLAGCALGLLLDRPALARAWLVGWLFWMGLSAGCVALLMLHHLVGGTWGFVLRRLLEAGAAVMPLMLLLALPLAAGLPLLYRWAAPSGPLGTLLPSQRLYLGLPFFLARSGVYLILWCGMAWLLRRWSAAQDRTGDPRYAARFQALSGPGLVLYAFSMSFAAVDWIMSLEPHWRSTIFGMLVIVGQGLGALALTTLVAALLVRRGVGAGLIEPGAFHDLGNLMLTFALSWAYLAFSQFLIIWSGNLAAETPWYLHRATHGWGGAAAVVVLTRFVLPFVLLLSSGVKRSPLLLLVVAGILLLGHYLDLLWMVAPSLPASVSGLWLYPAALLAIGGGWVGLFIRLTAALPLAPQRDPRLEEHFSRQRAGEAPSHG